MFKIGDLSTLTRVPVRTLLGDFNLNEQSLEYERIIEQFKDAHHEAGVG